MSNEVILKKIDRLTNDISSMSLEDMSGKLNIKTMVLSLLGVVDYFHDVEIRELEERDRRLALVALLELKKNILTEDVVSDNAECLIHDLYEKFMGRNSADYERRK